MCTCPAWRALSPRAPKNQKNRKPREESQLDLWKYYAISHERHRICNPLSSAKLDELVEVMELPDAARVLDIACGKGEFLARAAARWKCDGVGVDISPYFVADARTRIAQAGSGGRIEIIEANAAEYDARPESVDVACCLGASWIWGGYGGMLDALSGWAKSGSWVLAGEPFWRCDPPPAYLEDAGFESASFDTHRGNVEAGLERGLRFAHAIVASEDDWDRYEGYLTLSAERFAIANPDDPDVSEVLEQIRKARDQYFEWGRDVLGWAVYLFVKPTPT